MEKITALQEKLDLAIANCPDPEYMADIRCDLHIEIVNCIEATGIDVVCSRQSESIYISYVKEMIDEDECEYEQGTVRISFHKNGREYDENIVVSSYDEFLEVGLEVASRPEVKQLKKLQTQYDQYY